MIRVRKLLETKGRQIWSTTPDASVYDALTVMAEKRVGALVVLEGDKLCGVFSERDYARKVILQGKSSKETAVADVMSSKVFYISPDQQIDECMALMTDKSIRHLPVLDDGELVGVISIGDVVKATISQQEFIIDQLEHFITGR